jgi:hypothetical protein
MSFSKKIKFAGVGLLAASGLALATVTFNPSTGTGFVGKGDVQLAFGWNNAQAQNNLGSTSFTYVERATYAAVCTWTTGEGTRGEQTHNVTHTKAIGVDGAVSRNLRVHSQVDGIVLDGYTSLEVDSGTVPVVGGPCPGNNGTDGTWSSVAQTSSTIELDATYAGITHKIWP